jgi:hypothetical protein
LLESESTTVATEVVRALAVYQREDRIRDRLEKLVRSTGDKNLQTVLRECW